MEEKYTFDNLNLKLTVDFRYYGNGHHLWISFQSCSPYKIVPNLEDLEGTRFKAVYANSILKFCKGTHFDAKPCFPDSPSDNTFDIVTLEDPNIDLERFNQSVDNLLKVQYQYLSKQNLIRRKATNSTNVKSSISNDVLSRGIGFDPEIKDFGKFELQTDNEYDLDWIKIPTNVRAVKLDPDRILIYFGRYARIDRTSNDELSYVELTYDEALSELEMLAGKKKKSVTVTKKTSPKTKTSKSRSKKSKSKEVDHDN